METLRALRAIAEGLGATQMRGVATEVFRKARNGERYLGNTPSRPAPSPKPPPILKCIPSGRLGCLCFLVGGRKLAAEGHPTGAGQVQAQLGLQASLVAQEEEARLGWLTAVAGSGGDSRVISWDSGSGSFQITARRRGAGHGSGGSALLTYMGAWGSTIAAECLMTEVRQGEFDRSLASCNPVSLGEARALVA
jgi:hypothetical protein